MREDQTTFVSAWMDIFVGVWPPVFLWPLLNKTRVPQKSIPSAGASTAACKPLTGDVVPHYLKTPVWKDHDPIHACPIWPKPFPDIFPLILGWGKA